MSDKIIVKSKIKGKYDNTSGNEKAPLGKFLIIHDDQPLYVTTWNKDIWNKYNVGDDVEVGVVDYTDNEYGRNGVILHISYNGEKQENLSNTEPKTGFDASLLDGMVMEFGGRKFTLHSIN